MPPSPERAAAPGKDTQENSQLESLNERQLRELLDEAVTYKTPKDREGKSNLFRNLLQEVEQDDFHFERNNLYGYSIGSTSGKRGRNKRNLTNFPHSGSLQDLAGAGSGPDTKPLRPQVRQHRRPVPVSARSSQGGSLPANVDQQNFGVTENRRSFLEDVKCGSKSGGSDYIATVRYMNQSYGPLHSESSSDYGALRDGDHIPSPPNRASVGSPQPTHSAGCFDDDDSTEMEHIRAQRIPHTPNYKTSATIEIGSPSMTGDNPIDHGPMLSVVDSRRGCISSPTASQLPSMSVLETKPLQLESNYSAVSSVTGSAPLDGPNLLTGPLSSLQFGKSHHSLTPLQSHDNDKKMFDENFNALSNSSVSSTAAQHNSKKAKRKRNCKNEVSMLSEQIDGYMGNESEVDKLLEYIESGADSVSKNSKKNQSKLNLVTNKFSKLKDNDEKINKKRSMERKTKDGKLNSKVRANSMEELSRRKFDDISINSAKSSLTMRKSKKSDSDKNEVKVSERRSWCNDELESYYKQDNKTDDDLSNGNSSSLGAKNKKGKQTQSEAEFPMFQMDSMCNLETADFQTVTKKKKLRKKQSPSDENRNRPNQLYSNSINVSKIVTGKRSNQERDTIYKKGSRFSASSPPSDKSNDSNDDLDSVHSLPADTTGERLQASYADMARAAPPASPPPPPPIVNRPHNFPDLIESCNYYSNDVSMQDKRLDVSVENNKNLYQKDNLLDSDKCKVKVNSADSIQTDKDYIHEQYPALESRQKIGSKLALKSKIDGKFPNNFNKHFNQIEKKKPPKYGRELAYTEINSNSFNDDINLPDNYNNFVKHNNAVSSPNEPSKTAKFNGGKAENTISKHPDVVLPLAEMSQSNNRPAVIIMNEEVNRVDNVYNVDGITFGFDINEQLLNGDSSVERVNGADDAADSPFNSTSDFPAINERPCRDDKSKNVTDETKHSKRVSRLSSGKDGINFMNNKNSIVSENNQSNEANCNESNTKSVQGGDESWQVVEACVGQDKYFRYLTPTTTPKDIYNLDKIVNYVGLAWEDITKLPNSKVRYFNKQQ